MILFINNNNSWSLSQLLLLLMVVLLSHMPMMPGVFMQTSVDISQGCCSLCFGSIYFYWTARVFNDVSVACRLIYTRLCVIQYSGHSNMPSDGRENGSAVAGVPAHTGAMHFPLSQSTLLVNASSESLVGAWPSATVECCPRNTVRSTASRDIGTAVDETGQDHHHHFTSTRSSHWTSSGQHRACMSISISCSHTCLTLQRCSVVREREWERES